MSALSGSYNDSDPECVDFWHIHVANFLNYYYAADV